MKSQPTLARPCEETGHSPVEDVLFAAGRAPSIAEEDDVYGWLIGAWDLEAHARRPDGSVYEGRGEVRFAWVLEGRAVQDVWIARPLPGPGGQIESAARNLYGTTLRVFDPTRRVWAVTWINPISGAHDELVGRREGDEIVQHGHRPDGTRIRWRFTKIRPDSFHWIGEVAPRDRDDWKIQTEFLARRRGGERR